LTASTSASQHGKALSVSYSELPISIAILAKADALVQLENRTASSWLFLDRPLVETAFRDAARYFNLRRLCSSICVDLEGQP
jgi:hypothetical protein